MKFPPSARRRTRESFSRNCENSARYLVSEDGDEEDDDDDDDGSAFFNSAR